MVSVCSTEDTVVEFLGRWASLVISTSRWALRRQYQTVKRWPEGCCENRRKASLSVWRKKMITGQEFLCSHPIEKQKSRLSSTVGAAD